MFQAKSLESFNLESRMSLVCPKDKEGTRMAGTVLNDRERWNKVERRQGTQGSGQSFAL